MSRSRNASREVGLLLSEAKDAEAKKLLIGIVEQRFQSSVLGDDVKEHIVQLTNNPGDLEVLVEDWLQSDRTTWTWRSLGLKLFERSLEINDLDIAVRVGHEVVQKDPFNTDLRQKLIVSHYKRGETKSAWNLVEDSQRDERQPASLMEYESVVKQLRKEFGAP